VQLNVHVPKDRESLLRELDRAAQELDQTKSQLVLDAVEHYLKDLAERLVRDLDEDIPVYDLGPMKQFDRAELYAEHEDEKFAR